MIVKSIIYQINKIMADTKINLEPEKYYHIYNHAVGNELLFNSDNNYLFFLKLVKKYLIDYADIYAYCLMPNHFHFIIKVKDIEKPNKGSVPRRVNKKNIGQQFSNLFNSYAQTFNKENIRKGSLFVNRYKRKLISDEKYLLKLIHYIHFNPVAADLCEDLTDWKYSSYNAIIGNHFTLVVRQQILDLFEDKGNFIYCHKIEPTISGID